MTRSLMSLVCVILMTGLAATARSEAAPAAPAADAKPAGDQGMAVVKKFEGTVESRPAVGQPWAPVKVGQQLAEGSDVRTGFRACCVLDLAGNTVQLDPLTVARIGELVREGDKARTRIYMKQGSTQASVEKRGEQNDFAIVTPSATLSVRGTDGIRCSYFHQLGGQYGLKFQGLVAVTDHNLGRSAAVAPGQHTDDQATHVDRVQVSANQSRSARRPNGGAPRRPRRPR